MENTIWIRFCGNRMYVFPYRIFFPNNPHNYCQWKWYAYHKVVQIVKTNYGMRFLGREREVDAWCVVCKWVVYHKIEQIVNQIYCGMRHARYSDFWIGKRIGVYKGQYERGQDPQKLVNCCRKRIMMLTIQIYKFKLLENGDYKGLFKWGQDPQK